MNICHNVDATGEKGVFQATGEYWNPRRTAKGQLTESENAPGEALEAAEKEKRMKLRFELAELIRQSDSEPLYDITDVYQTVAAAVPQPIADPQVASDPHNTVVPQFIAGDELAMRAAGSRVLFGNMEEYMHVALGKKRRDWEKPSH
jgi:hypothetical protein